MLAKAQKIVIVFFVIFLCGHCAFAQVKKADLAGTWYPADAKELSIMLDGYLDAASVPAVRGRIVAIISPHAGFIYSAPVAAYGYKLLLAHKINTVIILAFSHRKYYDGISIYNSGEFQTPLGDLQVDEQLACAIMKKSDRVRFYPQTFESENSLETQLPFIKKVLPGSKIVPIIFGASNYEDARGLAGTLSEILSGRDDVVVVASTDMSHFKSYAEASRIDAQTIALMKQFKYRQIYDKGVSPQQPCCGYIPVTCALMMAENMAANDFNVLKYANSGDITGDKRQVVGYLSAIIYKGDEPSSVVRRPSSEYGIRNTEYERRSNDMEGKDMLNDAQRKRLLQIARESIISFVKNGKRRDFKEEDHLLNEPLGAFVTLHKNGQLRGCIGNMVGSGPLYKTVANMAVEAATADPRFASVSAAEIDKIDIEISVLSKMERVKDASEIKIPGHGVLVRRGFRSGVYLPQVADETGWNKEEFLTSLCSHKAGLSADAWNDPDTQLYVFTAEVFGEKE